MPEINITVLNKVASCSTKSIVNGNSDYVVNWTLDAAWDKYETKTMRVSLCDGTFSDTVFSGKRCSLPIINDAALIEIGLFAGDLITTTPAAVRCARCITDASGTPADPPDNVYNQIMERLAEIGSVSPEDVAQAVADYFTAHPIEETDPTVPAWAKATEKPTYTASEVGAIAADELSDAVNTALAQAKASGAFDGSPGKDGADGITPTIGDNGNWYLGTTDTGKPARGPTGSPGPAYTLTAEDKQAIVSDVLDALPTWSGGSY